jgi:3-hydroxyacyl-[acyl-carrier-protein] dehydratase
LKSKLKIAIDAAGISSFKVDGEGGTVGTFGFAADFPGFAGHFPGYPVLPAVVQVLTAQLMVEQMLDKPLVLQRLERAKFLKQVRPDQLLQVTCQQRKSGVWDVRLKADGEPAAAFWMTLAEESGL